MPLYRNRLVALLAALAVALQALWPLLSHARPAQAGILVAVCTIDGITHFLELPAGNTPLEQRSSAQHEHCPLCVFSAERLAALPPVQAAMLAVDAMPAADSFHVPAIAPDAVSQQPAQPRAPPAAS